MPVYDAAGTVAAALESVLAQTEPSWELVAVDDGSTDASAAIIDAYAHGDGRIRLLRAPHRGIVAALSLGLEHAHGALIARMDADDVCLPDRLARQRRRLEERPDLGLVACRVDFGGDPVARGGYARYVAWTNRLLSHDDIAAARFVESPLAHPSVTFRREVVERWGGYADGDFPEDYELWLRWLDAGVRMEKLAEPLLLWNDAPGRLSRHDPRYAEDAFYRVKARYLARWLARHNAHHPRVIVWGAGRVTRRRVRPLLAAGIEVAAWVDIDPRKIGRTLDGCPVLGVDALPPPGAAFVVPYVPSRGAREEIETRLRAAGYRAGVDYVVAA